MIEECEVGTESRARICGPVKLSGDDRSGDLYCERSEHC